MVGVRAMGVSASVGPNRRRPNNTVHNTKPKELDAPGATTSKTVVERRRCGSRRRSQLGLLTSGLVRASSDPAAQPMAPLAKLPHTRDARHTAFRLRDDASKRGV